MNFRCCFHIEALFLKLKSPKLAIHWNAESRVAKGYSGQHLHMLTCMHAYMHTQTHTRTHTELNLVDVLYQMLKDKDAQVVANCISALNEILASEGGMVVNTKIAHYLLNR